MHMVVRFTFPLWVSDPLLVARELLLMSCCVVSGKDITVSTYLQAVSEVPRKHGFYLWDGRLIRRVCYSNRRRFAFLALNASIN